MDWLKPDSNSLVSMVRYDVKKKKKILIQTQHWSDKRKWCKETKTSNFQQPNMIYIWLKQISGQKTEERHYFQHWVDQYKTPSVHHHIPLSKISNTNQNSPPKKSILQRGTNLRPQQILAFPEHIE